MRIELCSPAQGETVALLTDGHRAMLSGRHLAEADDSLDWRSLKQKGTEKSYPQPVKFVWKTVADEPGEQAACLFIGTAPDLADAKKVIVPAGENEAEVYNFSAGTEYYWKVVLTGPDGTSESPVGQFFARDEVPKLYRVDGMGATGLYLSTEDLARFCRLYLCEGVWEGKRLLSKAWCARVHAGSEGSYYGGFTSGKRGRFSVGGAYHQFGIIAPDKGVVLAGHSFVEADGGKYAPLRSAFLDSLPDA